jgi:hypothetical protein
MKRLGPDRHTRRLEQRARRKLEARAYERVLERAITDRVAQETEDELLRDDEPKFDSAWMIGTDPAFGYNCRCTLVPIDDGKHE